MKTPLCVLVAVVLLLASSLLIQSFRRLTQTDPGFDRRHVLTFQLDAPAGRHRAQVSAVLCECAPPCVRARVTQQFSASL